MERIIEQAYKRDCFQGRGIIGRWTDWLFFSCLGGLLFYIAYRIVWLSVICSLSLLLLQLALARHQWKAYYQTLKNEMHVLLRRENWLVEEAAMIRSKGEIVLFPVPSKERLIESCLNVAKGTRFHCFGIKDDYLCKLADCYGCTLVYHPWGRGKEPTEETVEKRIASSINVRKGGMVYILFSQKGIRYFITGGVLLLFSVFLSHALYWQILASVCFLFGTIKQAATSIR